MLSVKHTIWGVFQRFLRLYLMQKRQRDKQILIAYLAVNQYVKSTSPLLILFLVKLVAEGGMLIGYQGVRLHHYGLDPNLA